MSFCFSVKSLGSGTSIPSCKTCTLFFSSCWLSDSLNCHHSSLTPTFRVVHCIIKILLHNQEGVMCMHICAFFFLVCCYANICTTKKNVTGLLLGQSGVSMYTSIYGCIKCLQKYRFSISFFPPPYFGMQFHCILQGWNSFWKEGEGERKITHITFWSIK